MRKHSAGAALGLMLMLVGCGAPPAPESVTVTATSIVAAPTTSVPPVASPRSELVDIALPDGSVDKSAEQPDLEYWLVTTPYDFTVNFLREQLPINGELRGLPWCEQEVFGKLGLTQWSWADAQEIVVVAASRDGHVSITQANEENACSA